MNGETILVVDDNKEIVYSISELLKYEGNMPKAGPVLQTEMGSLFMLGEESIG